MREYIRARRGHCNHAELRIKISNPWTNYVEMRPSEIGRSLSDFWGLAHLSVVIRQLSYVAASYDLFDYSTNPLARGLKDIQNVVHIIEYDAEIV